MHSKTTAPRSRHLAGFTLIELLTVIAIIGILAAIIVPTVGRVRDSAKKAQCVARLRQWGTVISLCTNDYKNHVALFFKNDNGDYIHDPYITKNNMTVEDPKLGSTRNLKPTEAFTTCPNGQNGDNTVNGTIRQYSFVVPIDVPKKGARIFAKFGEDYFYRSSDASAPGKLLLMIEQNVGTGVVNPNGSEGGIKTELDNKVRIVQNRSGYIRHGGIANALFLDGHVGSLTLADTDYTQSREKLVQWFTLK